MPNGDITPYTGPAMADASLVTRDELAAGTTVAPEGTAPYTVQSGDNLYSIATQHGYGNPPNMAAFYADNQQYSARNPDLIYPGEQVFVRVPENGTTATGQTDPATNEPTFQNYSDGQPVGEPYSATAAPNGLPANSDVIDQEGNTVRTDSEGRPRNGDFSETVEVGDSGTYRVFTVTYENGQETRRVGSPGLLLE